MHEQSPNSNVAQCISCQALTVITAYVCFVFEVTSQIAFAWPSLVGTLADLIARH